MQNARFMRAFLFGVDTNEGCQPETVMDDSDPNDRIARRKETVGLGCPAINGLTGKL
jgi:hypothetical protein